MSLGTLLDNEGHGYGIPRNLDTPENIKENDAEYIGYMLSLQEENHLMYALCMNAMASIASK